MKIESDLRCAIKSAERAQPGSLSWQEQYKAKKAAVQALLKSKPSIAKKLKQARKLYLRAKAIQNQAAKLHESFGVDSAGQQISNEHAFLKAGGKLPPPSRRRCKSDEVMALLVQAAPKERTAILQRYNIRWD